VRPGDPVIAQPVRRHPPGGHGRAAVSDHLPILSLLGT
jgi:hypothetical protein